MYQNLQKNLEIEPNRFVLVQNDIVNSFFDCTTYQLRIILMCIAKSMNSFFEKKGDDNSIVEFSAKEFCDTMEIVNDGRVNRNLFMNLENISKLQIKLANKNSRGWVNWFEYVLYENNNDFVSGDQLDVLTSDTKIKIRFTRTVFDVIKVIGQKFTKLDFSVIGRCSSYSIRWYMMCRELMYLKGKGENKKNSWTVIKTFEEIKSQLNINQKYYQGRIDNFIRKVIKEPIQELNRINPEFEIGTPDKLFTKIKKGKITVGVMLECFDLTNTCKISNSDSYAQKQNKIAINNEEEFIKKFRDEFEELFEQEKSSPSVKLPFDNDLFRKARAITSLAKKHPIVAKRLCINFES